MSNMEQTINICQLELTQIGDVKLGKELGFKDRTHKFIWQPCPLCGIPRWVRLRDKLARCQNCNIRNPRWGSNHPSWKGGQTMQKGYVVIYNPEHPNHDINGYVKRCRLVVESKLGKILPREIDIHHINGIKTDDRPENLTALSHSEHLRLHGLRRNGLKEEKCNA